MKKPIPVTLPDGKAWPTQTAFAASLGLQWVELQAALNAGRTYAEIASKPPLQFPPMTWANRRALSTILALGYAPEYGPETTADALLAGAYAWRDGRAKRPAKVATGGPAPAPAPAPLTRAEIVQQALRASLLKGRAQVGI